MTTGFPDSINGSMNFLIFRFVTGPVVTRKKGVIQIFVMLSSLAARQNGGLITPSIGPGKIEKGRGLLFNLSLFTDIVLLL